MHDLIIRLALQILNKFDNIIEAIFFGYGFFHDFVRPTPTLQKLLGI